MVTIGTLNGGNITITTGSVLDATKTRFTLQDGTVEEYDITGTLDRQWMIDNDFFENENWLKNIIQADIGNTVTSIRDSTFSDCSGLTSVTIGSNIEAIWEGAFDTEGDPMTLMIGKAVHEVENMGVNPEDDVNYDGAHW